MILTARDDSPNVFHLMSNFARISMPMMAMPRPDFGALAPCRGATLA